MLKHASACEVYCIMLFCNFATCYLLRQGYVIEYFSSGKPHAGTCATGAATYCNSMQFQYFPLPENGLYGPNV